MSRSILLMGILLSMLSFMGCTLMQCSNSDEDIQSIYFYDSAYVKGEVEEDLGRYFDATLGEEIIDYEIKNIIIDECFEKVTVEAIHYMSDGTEQAHEVGMRRKDRVWSRNRWQPVSETRLGDAARDIAASPEDEDPPGEEEEKEKERETPQEFMDRYFQAAYDNDFDKMRSMSTDGLAADISMMEAFANMDGDVNRTVDYRIDSVEHEGDGGAVYNFTEIREDGSERSGTFVIANKGGEWVTTRF